MMLDGHRPASVMELATSVAFVLLCGLGVVAFFHYAKSHFSASRLQEMRRNNEAREALANEPPWVILNQDGSLSGLGPDIDRAVLGSMGIAHLNGQVMEYGAMIPALQAGRVDLVSSGSQDITPQRCSKVLFSEPVLCDAEYYIASRTLLSEIKRYSDVARLHLRIGTCGGCIEQRFALSAGVPASDVIVFPDGVSAIKMLESGRVSVVALPQGSLETVVSKTQPGDAYGMGPFVDAPIQCSAASFRKQDVALRDAYNRGLAALIANGQYEATLRRYDLSSHMALRKGRTTASLCAGN